MGDPMSFGPFDASVTFSADLRDSDIGEFPKPSTVALIEQYDGPLSGVGKVDLNLVETASLEVGRLVSSEDQRAFDESAVVEAPSVDDDALGGERLPSGITIKHVAVLPDSPTLSGGEPLESSPGGGGAV